MTYRNLPETSFKYKSFIYNGYEFATVHAKEQIISMKKIENEKKFTEKNSPQKNKTQLARCTNTLSNNN